MLPILVPPLAGTYTRLAQFPRNFIHHHRHVVFVVPDRGRLGYGVSLCFVPATALLLTSRSRRAIMITKLGVFLLTCVLSLFVAFSAATTASTSSRVLMPFIRENSFNSSTASLTSSINEYIFGADGRRYHAYFGPEKNLLPTDEV